MIKNLLASLCVWILLVHFGVMPSLVQVFRTLRSWDGTATIEDIFAPLIDGSNPDMVGKSDSDSDSEAEALPECDLSIERFIPDQYKIGRDDEPKDCIEPDLDFNDFLPERDPINGMYRIIPESSEPEPEAEDMYLPSQSELLDPSEDLELEWTESES